MPKNKKTRTNPIVIVLGIVMLVAFSLWFVFERPTSTVEDSGKLVPTPTSVIPKNAKSFAEERAYHLRSLELALGNQSGGRRIMQYYKERIGYAAITAPETLGFNPIEMQTKEVKIIVSSLAVRRQNGFPVLANWQHEHTQQLIFAPPISEYTEIWAGFRLAHEISHALAYSSGIMPPDPTDFQMQLDEVRANRLEHELIDGYSKGEYFRQIDAFLSSQTRLPNAPQEWYLEPDEALARQLDHLFPPSRGIHENATREGSLLLAMNERLAKLLGVSDRDLAKSFNAKHFKDTLFRAH